MTVTNRIQYGTMKQEQEGFVKQRSNKQHQLLQQLQFAGKCGYVVYNGEGYPWCKSFLALG
jgi:hypothetical protein